MTKNILFLFLFSLNSVVVSSCFDSKGQFNSSHKNTSMPDIITDTIVGSSENPDPILRRIRELERDGILTNIVVMESFPLQIKVTGPKEFITELKSLPRK